MTLHARGSVQAGRFYAKGSVGRHPPSTEWFDPQAWSIKRTRAYNFLYPKSHAPKSTALVPASYYSIKPKPKSKTMARRTKSRGRRSSTYKKKRKLSYKKKRAGRVGRPRRLAVVGTHWPPSVMRWTGTTQVTLNPTLNANNATNVAVFTLEGGVVGHVHTYFGGQSGGDGSSVPFATPRNFATISALYEQMRMVKVKYVIQFINQNDFEDFKVYWWTNTTTNRVEPIKAMGIAEAKPSSTAPWDTVEGVTHILDQVRSVSSCHVQSKNGFGRSNKTVSVTFGKTAFTGPDRWGVRMLGGRFNTDGTGPGISMAHAVGDIDVAFGLSPQLCFAVTNMTREATSVDITSIQVKKYVTVEFFNRVMDVGAA